MCGQAQSHLGQSAGEVLGPAEAYARDKSSKDEVERKCAERGIVFQPMIFQSTGGGVASEAEKVLKSLNRLVADKTNASHADVATRFWQRISIDLQRGGHRAWVRRVVGSEGGARDGMERVIEGVPGLEEPSGL